MTNNAVMKHGRNQVVKIQIKTEALMQYQIY